MGKILVYIGCFALALAAAAAAQTDILFDSKGFEPPLYVPGTLPGQDGWVNDTDPVAWTPPQIIPDPTGSGMGQLVLFDPPGSGSPWGWVGAYRANDSGPSQRTLVLIEWDQFREDIINNTVPEGDNFWYADRLDWTSWWAVQWDQHLMATHQEFIVGATVEGQIWEHVRYYFNFQAREVVVDVEGKRFRESMNVPSGFPVYTQIEGIDFEVEPTPPGLPEDPPVYVDNVKISEIPLMVDEAEVSGTTGGAVNFYLDAGPSNGSRNYIIIGGMSGTSPGIPLPGGMATLPINYDIFTSLMIGLINTPVFSNFMGTLDNVGAAKATFNLPPVGGGVGAIYFAYALNKPWNFVSDPVTVSIVP